MSLRILVAEHMKLIGRVQAARGVWGHAPENFNVEAQKSHFQHFSAAGVTYI